MDGTQEDPVHGPLGEYKKLEQQLKELKEEEQRNKELQIVQFPPSEIRYLDQIVAQRQISTISTLSDQEDYLLNSISPNYSTLLQGHGVFPSHNYNNPIEQRQTGLIPRQGFQDPSIMLQDGRGVSHLANYNGHVQLHQQRCSFNNNIDLGQGITRGRRRKECSDHQLVSPSSTAGRHVRGRGIGPISSATGIRGAIMPSSSSASFADQWTDKLRDSTGGGHCEVTIPLPSAVQNIADGRSNRQAEDFQHQFTNYNHRNLPGKCSTLILLL